MTERPDWVHCIRRTVGLPLATWCGRPATGWDFVDTDHAANNGLHKGRLVACRECVAAITTALQNGHDDDEYPASQEPTP